MKKCISVLMTILLTIVLFGCNEQNGGQIDNQIEQKGETNEEVLPMPTKQSNDKHIAYISNYVGKNCATIGYTSMGGDRNDYLGESYIRIIFETNDGSYVNIHDEEILKQYVVVAQSIEPNSEVKLGYTVDSEGNEYDYLVNFQSYEEIVLQVKKIKEDVKFDFELTKTKPAIDRNTYFIPDFVNRNLVTCGYISLGGDLRFKIGEANCKINIVSADGSYIELNEEVLQGYVVYAQSIEPNSEFKIDYKVDSDGNVYEHLVEHQSYKEIDLYVKPIN